MRFRIREEPALCEANPMQPFALHQEEGSFLSAWVCTCAIVYRDRSDALLALNMALKVRLGHSFVEEEAAVRAAGESGGTASLWQLVGEQDQ